MSKNKLRAKSVNRGELKKENCINEKENNNLESQLP